MAGMAPFGRDDQPLLEVKIIGGKRVEVAVDKYGKPLHQKNNSYLQGSKFQGQQTDRSSSVLPPSSPGKPSVLPTFSSANRNDAPPRKMLKSLDNSEPTHLSGSFDAPKKFSSPNSSPVLPPIKKDSVLDAEKTSNLASRLGSVMVGFDTSKLRDAYLNFAGFDSTLSGFVSADQIGREFFRLQVPVKGEILNELLSLFMSAYRPNWINYEQLLKFLSNAVQPTATREFRMAQPTQSKTDDHRQGKISMKSPQENNLPLKPNQVSPRGDEVQKGRQSAIALKKAFQSKQDTEILLQMEQLLKDVDNPKELVQALRRTLENDSVTGDEFVLSQKLKKICLQHHLPFNNSLLDMIISRLDRYSTGKISWVDFLSFVERALPISVPDTSSNYSQRSQSRDSVRSLETPPSKPVWETRQPLKAVEHEGRYPPRNHSLQSMDLHHEQEAILAKQLEAQRKTSTFSQQQQDSHAMQRTSTGDGMMEEDPHENAKQLEERRQKLLQRQQELIEQKRQVLKEQEEIGKVIQSQKEKLHGIDRENDRALYAEEETRVKRFMKLANALYVCDQDQSGLISVDEARRLLNNYNLVNQLEFSLDLVENSLRTCSTTDDKVSVDDLIDELKSHL